MSAILDMLPSLVPTKVMSMVSPVFNSLRREAEPDASRSVPEIIESRGFKAEIHQVATEDGYLLTIHRIINPFVAKKELEARPVLLQHGLASHAGHWLINSDDGYLEPLLDINDNRKAKPNRNVGNNLGFVLSNLGYDIWLGNFRGTRYSSRHKRLNKSDPKFWDFSIDEMVDNDLPAMINYILKKTNYSTLGYIGMSQGSNVMFGLLSNRPEFNDKIRPFIALAPAVKISKAIRVPIPVIKMTVPVPEFVKLPILRGINYVLQSTAAGPVFPYVDYITRTLGSGHMFEDYVNNLWYFIGSKFYDFDFDPKRLSVYSAHADLNISKRNLAHLIQINMFDEFTKYDFGDQKNKQLYGEIDPPEYDLKKITNRHIALIYSQNDMWTSVEDVDYISNTLNVPLLEDYLIPDKKWSHYDFIFGRKLGKYVNTKIIDLLKKSERV